MTFKREYDNWHLQMADGEEGTAASMHPWHITTARLLPDLNGARVLEIGCGRGDFALWLAQKTPTAFITAIDFSDSAINIARKRAAATALPVCFEVGDGQALRFDSESFDLVISCECLEHVPHPEKMLNEIRRVLTLGGQFILTTENYLNGMMLAWLKSWLSGQPFNSGSGVQPHENFFVFWYVKRMMKRSGLLVDYTESNHFQWLLLPRVAPASLCTKDFHHPFLKRLFRPFGRHFTFCGSRPK